MKEYLIYFTICILSTIKNVISVPPEYCLEPLNRSDCNLKPTAVFSYYKPGSRCEIQTWRGCPTFNKFDNEFQCSDLCIGRLSREKSDEDNIVDLDNGTQELNEPTDSSSSSADTCNKPLNTENCTDKEVTVYTYENSSCIPVTWRGCASENKFADEESCEKTCVKVNEGDWMKELEALPIADIEGIDNILEDFDKKDMKKEKLHLKGVVEITTTPAVTERKIETTESVTTKYETTTSGTTTLGTTTSSTTTLGTNKSEIITTENTKPENNIATQETTTIDDFQEVVLTKREGKKPK